MNGNENSMGHNILNENQLGEATTWLILARDKPLNTYKPETVLILILIICHN